MLATAQARCIRIVDAVPDEVIVVRPYVGADDATLGEAAARARVPVPVVLDELRAVAALAAHGPAGIDRSLAPALGGLFWHRSGDAPTGPKPIVTRADLGVDAKRDSRLPQAPSVVAVGPRTVFEQDAQRSTRGGGPPIPVLFVLAVLVVGAFIALIVMRSDDRPISQPPTVRDDEHRVVCGDDGHPSGDVDHRCAGRGCIDDNGCASGDVDHRCAGRGCIDDNGCAR